MEQRAEDSEPTSILHKVIEAKREVGNVIKVAWTRSKNKKTTTTRSSPKQIAKRVDLSNMDPSKSNSDR